MDLLVLFSGKQIRKNYEIILRNQEDAAKEANNYGVVGIPGIAAGQYT